MEKHIENISIDPSCPEELPVTTTGELLDCNGQTYFDGHTWWNSQISSTQQGKEYTIQMGTFDKEVFDKVSKVLAQIMDEEYARRHY
jgi:thymidylate synthase